MKPCRIIVYCYSMNLLNDVVDPAQNDQIAVIFDFRFDTLILCESNREKSRFRSHNRMCLVYITSLANVDENK